MPLLLAIMASGRGSNAKAILEAIEQGKLDAKVQCVISNMPHAPVLTMADNFGVPTFCIFHQGLSRENHETQVLNVLKDYQIDYLVLAGYMRLMTPTFLSAFHAKNHYRIINIHPALLPAFPGAHGYEDAFQYGVKISGVTVHFVDEGIDTGPILMQESFPRLDDDTLETFKSRGLALEHVIYPKALQLLAQNRVRFIPHSKTGRVHVEVKAHAVC